MGIIGHVVGAQSFIKDDGMRIAFEKFTQRSFEFAVGTEDIDAVEIDLGQVEEVVDIPVHTFGAAGEEIADDALGHRDIAAGAEDRTGLDQSAHGDAAPA